MLFFPVINEIAVLASALLAVSLLSLWYSPLLFGELWKKRCNDSYLDGENDEKRTRVFFLHTILPVLLWLSIFSFFAYARFLFIKASLPLFFLLSFFITTCVMILALISILERRGKVYFLLHAGYVTLTLFVGFIVIHYWPF